MRRTAFIETALVGKQDSFCLETWDPCFGCKGMQGSDLHQTRISHVVMWYWWFLWETYRRHSQHHYGHYDISWCWGH